MRRYGARICLTVRQAAGSRRMQCEARENARAVLLLKMRTVERGNDRLLEVLLEC
jgi:hypothetical protein